MLTNQVLLLVAKHIQKDIADRLKQSIAAHYRKRHHPLNCLPIGFQFRDSANSTAYPCGSSRLAPFSPSRPKK